MYILDDFKICADFDEIADIIGCEKDSGVYDEFKKEYDCIKDEMYKRVKSGAILKLDTLSEKTQTEKYPYGTKVIYAVITIGDEIEKKSAEEFENGNYVRGLIYDAFADAVLFRLDDIVTEKIKKFCSENKIGISERLEAPNDIPLQLHSQLCTALNLKENLGITVNEMFMFSPVKTMCGVFVVTDDEKCFNAVHDCRKCTNVNCTMRKFSSVEIKVQTENEIKAFYLNKNESLMNGLIRGGFYIDAVCGGKGRCGKCAVRVTEGIALVSDKDRSVFSQKDLADGKRLSCTLYPDRPITVCIETKNDLNAVIDYKLPTVNIKKQKSEYQIAVDIGTTTIVLQLINTADMKVQKTVSMINSQRRYGADVISRIQAAAGGKADGLRNSIRNDLKNGILTLCNECKISETDISKIVISANTTMIHLLMGYDCMLLGQYPFTPVNIDFIKESAKNIIGINSNTEVVLIAGISAYVGGDIVSGLYAYGFADSDDICMLIDLGTNGEMAIGNKNRILVTSVAAGPAFEGGNITFGTASVDGAICGVKTDGENMRFKTINNKPPIGICGTGVIELTAELLHRNIIDSTGLLDEKYFENGFPLAKKENGENIVFTQKDIREIQLAKAAVRAGTEILLSRYTIEAEKVSKVYIAGGFGYKLDIEKAAEIGMLPKELSARAEAVGNSSLMGAVKFLSDKNAVEKIKRTVEVSEEKTLSTDEEFNNIFIENMMF